MTGQKLPPRGEFVALVAVTISLVALSIDAMLPALAQIAAELGAREENDRQAVITMLFLGLAGAQMIYGPISDSIGRKPAIYAGFGIFIAGCLISLIAVNFSMMLVGRLLQGIGAAGPRVLAVAMVRDQYHGNAMASIMSTAMAVFILVPIIAPALGQLVLSFAGWQAIFGVLLLLSVITLAWHALRQPETLAPERRMPFSFRRVGRGIAETCRNPVSLGYTIVAGLIFGAFVGYLTSSQQIFQELYGAGKLFPAYFAALALSIGAASLVNARLVMIFGMRRMSAVALSCGAVLSVLFWIFVAGVSAIPPMPLLMAYFLAAFFCFGILFGNFNALAMEPLGHIAGVAAAVIGSFTTFISLGLGGLIGNAYDGTLLPLATGFAALSTLSLMAVMLIERGRRRASGTLGRP
jgi:DHA1 family bicyclomycin/chloramphenicol resistance-like MFS transporter